MLLLLWSRVAKKKKHLLLRLHLQSLRLSKTLAMLLLWPLTLLLLPPLQHPMLLALQQLPPVLPLLLLTPLATQPRPPLPKQPRLLKLQSSKLTLALQRKKPPSGGFFSFA